MKILIARLSTRIAAAGAVVAALTIGGCSESTAPTATSRGLRVGADGRPDLRPSGPFGGSRSTTFTVTAAGGSFDVGMFTVNFPANSICDPNTSGYGPGTWDSPCNTLADGQSVTVTATSDGTHEFSAPGVGGWTFVDAHHETFAVTFDANPTCSGDLANTGVNSVQLGEIGGIVLLFGFGLQFLSMGMRRRPNA